MPIGDFKVDLDKLAPQRTERQRPTFRSLNSSQGPDVKLWIFPPMVKPDAIVRPIKYNITTRTLDKIFTDVRKYIKNPLRAKEIMDGSANSFVQKFENPHSSSFGLSTDFSHDEIYPSPETDRYGRKDLNDCYRFALVVTNAPLTKRFATKTTNNRCTYTGYFLDKNEPVSRHMHLNPDAELIFTHATIVGGNDTINVGGYNTSANTLGDFDITPPDLADLNSNRSTDRDVLLAPDQIMRALSTAEDDEEYSEVGVNSSFARLSHSAQAKAMDTVYNNTRKQIARVLAAATNAAITQRGDERYVTTPHYTNEFSDYLDIRDPYKTFRLFGSALRPDSAALVEGPSYWRKRIKLRDLIFQYPNLENNTVLLDPVEIPVYNVMDEEANNLLTLSTAFIKTSIPPIMVDFGLSDCTFRYASSDPRDIYTPARHREPIYHVEGAIPTDIDATNEDVFSRCECAIRHCIMSVFSVVESMAGDIEVLVDYRNNDDTIVQLQLREQTDVINNEVGIHLGDMGGLISPNVGSIEDFSRGAESLMSLIKGIDSLDSYKTYNPEDYADYRDRHIRDYSPYSDDRNQDVPTGRAPLQAV